MDSQSGTTSASLNHFVYSMSSGYVLLRTHLARIERFLRCDEWAIGVVRAPIHSFLNPSFDPVPTWICAPDHGGFLADGFGVIDGGQRFIVAERFSYRGTSRIGSDPNSALRQGRGYITSIALDEFGREITEVPAIDTGQHMSFPFTIYDRGSWYLVAEEASRDTLNLYKRYGAGDWRHVKELLPHAVIDAAVISHFNRWWMFGSLQGSETDALHIWSADDLEGTWSPHPLNPVRSGRYNTRSGGTPFIFDGHLYRPTQNCTTTYGGSVVVNRVDVLTRDSFEEHAVRELLPLRGSRFRDGIHTLSEFGDWTLIDAKRRFVLPAVVMKRLLAMLDSFLTPALSQ